jgi:ubiquinol-cytochrome c reductase cytochrome b subunit
MFSGEFGQLMGAVVVPVTFMILLVALPFFDKDPERNIFKRPIALIAWIFMMAMIAIFTVSSIINREFLD